MIGWCPWLIVTFAVDISYRGWILLDEPLGPSNIWIIMLTFVSELGFKEGISLS